MPRAVPRSGLRAILPSSAGLITLGGILIWGPQGEWSNRLCFVMSSGVLGGSIAALWLVAAGGLGGLWKPATHGARCPNVLRASLGVATLLWLSHLTAWLSPVGLRGTSITLLAAGIGMLIAEPISLRSITTRVIDRPEFALAIPGLAILFAAAASMPGWLWNSEANGYDVLSYHLRLPEEWIRAGQLQDLPYNVYSFMPSSVEATFAQIGGLFGSLNAFHGMPLLVTQQFCALLAVTTSIGIGSLVRAEYAGPEGKAAGALASSAFLLCPWVQVTGSMSYDEMASCLLLLGALAAALDDRLPTRRRAALVGALVMSTVCAKLTSIVVLPILAILAKRIRSYREIASAALVAGIAGVVVAAPWLLRNLLMVGNPIFPFGSEFFGMGHWDADQYARWHGGVDFHGTFTARIAAAWNESLMHPQWAGVQGLFALATLYALVSSRTRRVATEVSTIIAIGVLTWFLLTPTMPRYLVPLLVPGAFGFGIATTTGLVVSPRMTTFLVALALVGVSIGALKNLQRERTGEAFRFLRSDAHAIWTGIAFEGASNEAPISYFLNRLEPASRVYALGDARTLYLEQPVVYFSSWDRWWITDFVRRDPGSPSCWIAGLTARGVSHLWINEAELQRMRDFKVIDPLLSEEVVNRLEASLGLPLAQSASSRLYALPRDASVRCSPS